MDISNIKPISIGSKYIARVDHSRYNKWVVLPKPTYLCVTSRGTVVECNIDMATEVSTIQEIIDMAYAYRLGIKYEVYK